MKQLLLSSFIVFCLFSVQAQNTLKGKVVDSSSGEPLENAVINAGPGRSALTDAEGSFILSGAVDSVRVSFVGYAAQTIASLSAQPLVIRLVRGNVDLRSVTVQTLPNNASFRPSPVLI